MIYPNQNYITSDSPHHLSRYFNTHFANRPAFLVFLSPNVFIHYAPTRVILLKFKYNYHCSTCSNSQYMASRPGVNIHLSFNACYTLFLECFQSHFSASTLRVKGMSNA
jgi:hypothetical protein